MLAWRMASAGQRIHHRGQHAHVVGRGAVHAGSTASDAAEDVAAADDDRDLDTQLHDFGNVIDHALDGGTVDAEGIVAHQGFAGQFQKDALVGRHVHLGLVLDRSFERRVGAGGTKHLRTGRAKIRIA
jgi:hypothetical protein